jgi:hypothetical protein
VGKRGGEGEGQSERIDLKRFTAGRSRRIPFDGRIRRRRSFVDNAAGLPSKGAGDTIVLEMAVLSGHAALQGACICILTRTDGLGALKKESDKAVWEKLYGETPNGRKLDDENVTWPDEWLCELPELLKKLPGDLSISLPGKKVPSYGFDVQGDLRRLHEFRNMFTRFPPKTWLIESSGLPRMLESAILLTRRITSSPHYQRHNRFAEMDLEPLFEEIICLLPSKP